MGYRTLRYVDAETGVTRTALVKTFGEHPEVDFPAALHERGFVDESWHNDACAKAERAVFDDGREYPRLRAWVDVSQVGLREMQDQFYVVVIEDVETDDFDDADVVYNGDDEDAMARAVDAYLAKRRAS